MSTTNVAPTRTADQHADVLLELAGFQPGEAVIARELAEGLFGDGCLRSAPQLPPHVAFGRLVLIPPGLAKEERRAGIMDAIAAYWVDEGAEVDARELAAALVAPRGRLVELRDEGLDVAELAVAFATDEATIAKRLEAVA